MKQLIAPVISNAEVMSNVYLIWLQAPEIASIASPGQFVMVRCGEGYELLLRRPFSIHQVTDQKLALLFTVVGKGTDWLSQRQEGDPLDLLGPLGKGFPIYPGSQNLLLVAGGIGIAPLVFLAQKALSRKAAITLLLGAQSSSLLYPKSMLPSEVDLVVATEDGSEGRKGMVSELVPDFVSWADQVFACGPTNMYRAIATQSQSQGKSIQVSLEARMGCGLGVCYGCTIRTKQGLQKVCKDGPIFEMKDILWEEVTSL